MSAHAYDTCVPTGCRLVVLVQRAARFTPVQMRRFVAATCAPIVLLIAAFMWWFSPVSGLLLRRGLTRLLRHSTLLAAPLLWWIMVTSVGIDPNTRFNGFRRVMNATGMYSKVAVVALASVVVYAAVHIVTDVTFAPSMLRAPVTLILRDVGDHGWVSATLPRVLPRVALAAVSCVSLRALRSRMSMVCAPWGRVPALHRSRPLQS